MCRHHIPNPGHALPFISVTRKDQRIGTIEMSVVCKVKASDEIRALHATGRIVFRFGVDGRRMGQNRLPVIWGIGYQLSSGEIKRSKIVGS